MLTRVAGKICYVYKRNNYLRIYREYETYNENNLHRECSNSPHKMVVKNCENDKGKFDIYVMCE